MSISNNPTANFYFQDLEQNIAISLSEDIGSGDLTADIISTRKTSYSKSYLSR